MNTHKFTGDMADQIEKDRDELVALRSKCERLEGELSGISGQLKAILEREKEARWLIDNYCYSVIVGAHRDNWFKRRDAWLKGGQP